MVSAAADTATTPSYLPLFGLLRPFDPVRRQTFLVHTYELPSYFTFFQEDKNISRQQLMEILTQQYDHYFIRVQVASELSRDSTQV